MAKPTPGPWTTRTLVPGETDIVSPDGTTLAVLFGDNMEADARLMAAAPEMLAMLKSLIARAEGDAP